jgi:hypothetical protein
MSRNYEQHPEVFPSPAVAVADDASYLGVLRMVVWWQLKKK